MEGHAHGREQNAASAATTTSHFEGLGWRRGERFGYSEIERRLLRRGGEMSFAMSCLYSPTLETGVWS